MTEAVIGRLSMIRALRVVSRTSVMQFKDMRISAPEIAKALHVDALVEGSVMREGNRVRVHAQLIRGASDEHIWSDEYDRELGDALALESDVAQAIAIKVEATITGQERARLLAARHVAPEVYESYLKGAFAWHRTEHWLFRGGDKKRPNVCTGISRPGWRVRRPRVNFCGWSPKRNTAQGDQRSP